VATAGAIFACGIALVAITIWATTRIVGALDQQARRAEGDRLAQLLAVFAPGVSAAATDPRALLVWHPLAQTARTLLPDAFVALDRAAGRTFPFSREQVEAAHAAWTASWLAWEQSHDAEFKLKAQTLSDALGLDAATTLGRSRLEAVERERVERYQQRYEEYTRVAKALQRLNG
jgi:hypothetical protein